MNALMPRLSAAACLKRIERARARLELPVRLKEAP